MSFSTSRAELYEDAIETLLRKWDSSRQIQRDEIYRALSYKRKLQLLMGIAVPTFKRGEIFFRQRDLEQWIVNYLIKLPGAPESDSLDSSALLKAMETQHSILIERAQGIYSFSHLTFQEYLTARYLAENQGNEMIGRLIRSHLTDHRWREVFLLTASLLDNADIFISILRQTIDSVVAEVSPLIQLLSWANIRASETNALVEQQHTIQLTYIFLACARIHTLDFSRTRALVLALDFARATALDFARALTRDFSIVLAMARVLALALVRVLALARALALATTSLVGFDYGLYYTWSYTVLFCNAQLDRTDEEWRIAMQALPDLVKGLAAIASEGQRDDLAQQLLAEQIPPPGAHTQAWQQCADSLFAILCDERDLGRKWEFTNEEIDKLNNYLYASELLVQCLKVAAVSNRQAILHSLLLPPSYDKKIEEDNK